MRDLSDSECMVIVKRGMEAMSEEDFARVSPWYAKHRAVVPPDRRERAIEAIRKWFLDKGYGLSFYSDELADAVIVALGVTP